MGAILDKATVKGRRVVRPTSQKKRTIKYVTRRLQELLVGNFNLPTPVDENFWCIRLRPRSGRTQEALFVKRSDIFIHSMLQNSSL